MQRFRTIDRFFREPKTIIGWAHGTLTLVGSFVLAYLCGMSVTLFLKGDMAERLFPAMFLFPFMVCIFGFWLLFSKNILRVMMKITLLALLNACIITLL